VRFIYGLPLVALVSPLPVFAQDATPANTPQPDDIVVLGSGLPLPPGTPAYGSVVIDRDRLTGDASGRVEDVLTDVAGLQQFRRSDSRSANPSAQGVTLRSLGGNASSRALVLLDGVPIADPFFGYIPFNALVADRLAGVRITRGGGAGAFGAGAVAGTIELASATRADLPVLSGSADYGSFNSEILSGSYSPNVGSGFVSASGKWERSDGYFTTPAAQSTRADARAKSRDWSGSIRAVAPIDSETEIQARGLVFRDNRTLRFQGADSSSEGEDASIRLIHRGDWAIDALAYVQARNFTNKVISSSNFKLSLDQRNTPSTGLGGKIELRPPVGSDHVLRVGVDARYADGELFEDAYNTTSGLITTRRNAGGDTSTIGAFVEDDWTIGKLVLTGGVRGDRWTITNGFIREVAGPGSTAAVNGSIITDKHFADRDGLEGTGRVGALFHANTAVALRVAGYTGFRLPTLNELYRPFVVFPVTTSANENLGLEKLKGFEGGIDLTPLPGVSIGITGFYNRLDGAIANVTTGTNVRQRQNVEAIVAKGIEVTAEARHGAFSLNGSYAFSDSHVRASGLQSGLNGFIPAQSPRHTASATMAWQPKAGPGLSTTVRYIGKQFEDDLQTNVLPDVWTVDAIARMPIGRHFAIVARAENLFDATIITRNQAGSMDLGTPRTLWIGVRFTG
jgi:outer membrane cobalamin receptor